MLTAATPAAPRGARQPRAAGSPRDARCRRRRRSTRSRGSGGSTPARRLAGRPSPRARATARWRPTSTTSPPPRTRRPGRARRAALSASTPGNPRWALPATFARAVTVLERAGDRGDEPVDQAVAHGCDADDVGVAIGDVARSAAAIATAPATFDVPERSPPSWPPPSMSGSSAAPPRTTSAPVPLGPPNLCAEIATRSAPAAALRDVEPRDRLDRVGVHDRAQAPARGPAPRPRRAVGSCPPRCSRASATRPRCARRPRRARASRSTTPFAPAPTRTVRKPSRSEAIAAASTPLCSNAAVTTPVRTGPAPRPGARRPLHRQVVGLGPARGEHHLGGAAPEQLGDLLAGRLRARSWPPGRPHDRRSGCRSCPAGTGSIAATASGRIGVVAAWSR